MPDAEPRSGSPFASENPYQSPLTRGASPDVVQAQLAANHPDNLRRVAIYQKGVLFAVAIYLIYIALSVVDATTGWRPPPIILLPFVLLSLVAFICGIISVGLLSARLHGVVIGVLLAILTFVPCVNLIVLFIVNQQANKLLASNGIHVGLFGARMRDLPAREVR